MVDVEDPCRPAPTFTTAATRGCSCERIIAARGGRHEQDARLGCGLGTMESWIGGLP